MVSAFPMGLIKLASPFCARIHIGEMFNRKRKLARALTVTLQNHQSLDNPLLFGNFLRLFNTNKAGIVSESHFVSSRYRRFVCISWTFSIGIRHSASRKLFSFRINIFQPPSRLADSEAHFNLSIKQSYFLLLFIRHGPRPWSSSESIFSQKNISALNSKLSPVSLKCIHLSREWQLIKVDWTSPRMLIDCRIKANSLKTYFKVIQLNINCEDLLMIRRLLSIAKIILCVGETRF